MADKMAAAQKRPVSVAVTNPNCPVCSKPVYEMEKMPADDKVFHKTCFRCKECNNVLSLGNFAAMDGVYYCKPHFKQLFKLKGNYDEGFGREPHKAQWNKDDDEDRSISPSPSPLNGTAVHTSSPSPSPNSPVPSSSTTLTPQKSIGSKTERPASTNLGTAPKCHVCEKPVYEMDKMKADEIVFHKACFRCTHCNNVLSLGNFAAMKGVYYCKPHFKQLFKLKGNYDEGFGNEQHKAKWTQEDEKEDS